MGFLNSLKWQKELSKFDERQKKVLLALSRDKYSWCTKESIAKTTGMSENEVEETMEQLISKDKIRPTFSKSKKIIFGLRERVS